MEKLFSIKEKTQASYKRLISFLKLKLGFNPFNNNVSLFKVI